MKLEIKGRREEEEGRKEVMSPALGQVASSEAENFQSEAKSCPLELSMASHFAPSQVTNSTPPFSLPFSLSLCVFLSISLSLLSLNLSLLSVLSCLGFPYTGLH